MNWNQQAEEHKPLTPEEMRAAFSVLLGPEFVDEPPQQNELAEAMQKINFPEMENTSPTLSLQQIKHVGNTSETGFSDLKPVRAPYEPKRGPRGVLNELPSATQQKILDMLETQSRSEVAKILAKPAPEGLGLHVTERILQGFENRHRLIEKRAEVEALANDARQLASDPTTTDADLTTAALRIVRASVLEYASDIRNFDALERLNNVLYRLRRADQTDRRQAYLERTKTKQLDTK